VGSSTEESLPFLSVRYPNGSPARPLEDVVRLSVLPATWANFPSLQAKRVMYLDHFPPFDFKMQDWVRPISFLTREHL
jgi:hypothetical protein